MSPPTAVIDAIRYLQREASDVSRLRPDPAAVVTALATLEKQRKKSKQRYRYEDLVGTWQLGFVSGTRKAKPARSGAKPIKQLGKGRFLPRWIQITITYGLPAQLLSPALLDTSPGAPTSDRSSDRSTPQPSGAVINQVVLGAASLQLSGPTVYWPKTNTLGFDFVYLQGRIGALKLYDAPVRGGKERCEAFATLPLKDQAFFTFFAAEKDYIAARGKGGGLALWTRSI